MNAFVRLIDGRVVNLAAVQLVEPLAPDALLLVFAGGVSLALTEPADVARAHRELDRLAPELQPVYLPELAHDAALDDDDPFAPCAD